jgi:hypothetical protein
MTNIFILVTIMVLGIVLFGVVCFALLALWVGP